jgi:uncharacterized protein YdcH (DUF465 family)
MVSLSYCFALRGNKNCPLPTAYCALFLRLPGVSSTISPGREAGLSLKDNRRKTEMSFSETEALKQQLLANDTNFAALAHEHSEYEKRLSELAALHYPSVAEQMEESTLKKKKLFIKDQMESILRRYKEQQQAASH